MALPLEGLPPTPDGSSWLKSPYVRIAATRALFHELPRRYDGWCNQNLRIYMLCPYHRERSPSLVVYPPEGACKVEWTTTRIDGRLRMHVRKVPLNNGVIIPAHFHCYGCGESGSLEKLREWLRTERYASNTVVDAPIDDEILGPLPF